MLRINPVNQDYIFDHCNVQNSTCQSRVFIKYDCIINEERRIALKSRNKQVSH